jgi:hypothetical protein
MRRRLPRRAHPDLLSALTADQHASEFTSFQRMVISVIAVKPRLTTSGCSISASFASLSSPTRWCQVVSDWWVNPLWAEQLVRYAGCEPRPSRVAPGLIQASLGRGSFFRDRFLQGDLAREARQGPRV